MTKRSIEIEAVVHRWIDAHRNKKGRSLTNMFSNSEHLRVLGSAPGEYWSGSLLRRGYANHVAEISEWIGRNTLIEGFERGDVGWAVWQANVTFNGHDEEQDVRFSFVLTLDDGLWRVVQVHCSIARSNMASQGFEHHAFANLIEAAKAGHERIEGEGTAVIMFTDVANSTQIAHAVGDRKWAVTIGRLLDLKALEISDHDGSLVKTLGDGSMSSFRGATGAMRAAIAIQSAAAKIEDDPKLEIRIGIHAGDVVQTEDDFYGTVVNKAARLAALAKPSEILVSDVVRAMAGERTDFEFSDPIGVALRGIEGRHLISSLAWIV